MTLDRRTVRKLAIALGVLVVAVVVGWKLRDHVTARHEQAQTAAPIPVTAASVEQADVPIILRGLGQVQAYNTFVARSRVDGNITEIGYREGQHVKAGDLLIQIDPRPYQAALLQAQGALARDQAQLDNALRDLGRYATLVRPGLTTQQTYDAQRAQVDQYRAIIETDQAQVQQAQLNLEYSSIRAPFDGRVGVRNVDIGNLVRSTDQTALVTLTQLQPIFVNFALPEQDLERVRDAMEEGPTTVMAFDGSDRKELEQGTLTVINNTVDPATGTVSLKAKFADTDEALWPGQFVNAHLVVDVQRNGILIPSVAVLMGPNGRYVFRITPDNKVEAAPVEIAQIEANRALVTKGLGTGDRVVVDGSFGLTNGASVAPTLVPAASVERETPSSPADLTGRTPAAPRLQSQQAQAPTESQTPQPQTAPAGQRFQGEEAPGTRNPGGNEEGGGVGRKGNQGS